MDNSSDDASDSGYDKWHSSPLRQHSAGPAHKRKQAQLKLLVELEVHGFVFEHPDVPHLFFPKKVDLLAVSPKFKSAEVQKYIRDLKRVTNDERGAYKPLVALFNYVARQGHGPHTNGSTQRIFFIVYDKQMRNLFDGAGHLKPDGLGSDTDFPDDQRVPWVAVWIAIEVKESWPEAMQQALTYARSMLEVGDKWYSLVLIFNQQTTTLRFCFATRQGVFVSPIWSLMTKEFDLAACALLHACHASGSATGRDPLRFFDKSGQLHLIIPPSSVLQSQREVFHRIQVVGRATHIYLVTRAADDSVGSSTNDPPGLEDKLAGDHGEEPVRVTNPFERTEPPSGPFGAPPPNSQDPASRRPDTHSAQRSEHAALPFQHQLLPVPKSQTTSNSSASASMTVSETWDSLCKSGTQPFWFDGVAERPGIPKGEFVVKDTWVVYERRDVETTVLRAAHGCYGIVDYVGHMIVPCPGLERLSVLGKAETSRYNCSKWSAVNRGSGGPIFVRRVRKLIFYGTVGTSLADSEQKGLAPRLIAQAMTDMTAALYILFRKGYLHRDISMGNILLLPSPVKRDELSVLNLLTPYFGEGIKPFARLFTEQNFLLCDFDHAVEWAVPRTYVPGRSGTWAFLAAARMSAVINMVKGWDDSLIDDFEALVMVLFYDTLKTNLGKATPMEKRHYESFLSDDPYHLAATKHMFLGSPSNAGNLGALKETWPLWWRLFEVASKSRLAINDVKKFLGRSTFAGADDKTKEELNRVCKQAAYDYLRAVQEALRDPAFGKPK